MIHKHTPLKEILEVGKACNRCGHCCKFSSGFLVGSDIKPIAKFLKINQDELKETFLTQSELFNTRIFKTKTEGLSSPCIFFSKSEGCTINPVKPLFCKVANCFANSQDLIAWFYLNYLVNPKDPESIRQYKIYLESDGHTILGGNLEEIIPDKERLRKILSFEIL